MNARTYTCGCGKIWEWYSGTDYHEIILAARNFLQHRHDQHLQGRDACRIPRRSDEWQALDDIKWAAVQIGEQVSIASPR